MSSRGKVVTVTKEKRYGIARNHLTSGWDSIHATEELANKAARALARKTKKIVRVNYWSHLRGNGMKHLRYVEPPKRSSRGRKP